MEGSSTEPDDVSVMVECGPDRLIREVVVPRLVTEKATIDLAEERAAELYDNDIHGSWIAE